MDLIGIEMLKEPVQKQEIINLLKIHYGIDVQSVQHLLLGADANALVYRVDTGSHSYFVKIKYGNHEQTHIDILNLLHDAGINEIIFPIATGEGKLFKQLKQFKMIVYPFIDGQNGFNQKLTKNQWIELGKTLKKVHSLSVPESIQQQLRKEIYSTKWRESVRSLHHKMEPDLSDDKITVEFKIFFNKHIDSIYQLLNSADNFARKIQPNPDNYVLCHSDIHAGNILITADESLYIVDWDDPMMAPKERDLMFIGGGVGNVWNSPQEINYFYEGYGVTNIDNTILAYYRHERIVEDIALFIQDILSTSHNNQSRSTMLGHFKSMFEPNGVVEIAFNTK